PAASTAMPPCARPRTTSNGRSGARHAACADHRAPPVAAPISTTIQARHESPGRPRPCIASSERVTVPFLPDIQAEISLRLGAALAVGGLIGLERSYHARPAGFRTHALVCLSTSLLMLVTV